MELAQMQQNHIYDQLDNLHIYSPKRNRIQYLPNWLFQYYFEWLEGIVQEDTDTGKILDDKGNPADISNTDSTQVRKHQMYKPQSIFKRTHQHL